MVWQCPTSTDSLAQVFGCCAKGLKFQAFELTSLAFDGLGLGLGFKAQGSVHTFANCVKFGCFLEGVWGQRVPDGNQGARPQDSKTQHPRPYAFVVMTQPPKNKKP